MLVRKIFTTLLPQEGREGTIVRRYIHNIASSDPDQLKPCLIVVTRPFSPHYLLDR